MTGHFAVLKPIGAAPDREHELDHELFRTIAAITAGLGETAPLQGLIKIQMIEHPFEEPHATPGGDFLVGKPKLKAHGSPVPKKCIAYPAQSTPET